VAPTVLALVVVPTALVTLWLRDRAQQHEQQTAAVTRVVEDHLPALEVFVAQRTGRPWKTAVRARILDDAAFGTALRDVGGGIPHEPSSDDDDIGVTMTAMGLVDDPETFYGSVVEQDYYDAQPTSWQNAVDDADGSAVSSGVPVVDAMGGFPYRAGAVFVRGLRDAGGTAAVTRAWGSPPRWSRDLVNPKGWMAGTVAKVTLTPTPKSPSSDPADTADIGVLGVGGLWLAVEGAHEHPSLAAMRELDGWTGDSYVATENAGATRWCFVDDVTFTDAASRQKAYRFLEPWLAHSQTRATYQRPTGIHLAGCVG